MRTRRFSTLLVALVGLAALPLLPAARAEVVPRGDATYHTFSAPDGTALRVCVILPDEIPAGGVPAVLEWTGYTIEDTTTFPPGGCPPQFGGLADRLVPDGYAFVAGNPRGVGASGGDEWDFWGSTDGADGAAAVEWIADQAWSNGNVGIVGCSGSAQSGIQVAEINPEPLEAAAFACFTADAYRGSYYPGGMRAWTWMVLSGRPFHDLGPNATTEMVARGDRSWLARPLQPAELWADNVAHPTRDAYWADKSILDGLDRLPPTYAFGNWADFFGIGPLEIARHLRPDDRVMIHTGGHGGSLTVTGPNGMFERVHRYFDHHLRTATDPKHAESPTVDPHEPPVVFWELQAGDATLYGGGEPAGHYHGATQWPPAGVRYQPLYLRGDRSNSQTSLNDGSLSPQPPTGDELADAYTYPSASPGSLHDRRQTFVGQDYDAGLEVSGGAVTYTSAPLAQAVSIAGPVTLSFWATTTASDTDFVVRLIDVDPQGQPHDVTTGWLKASHRALDPIGTVRADVTDGSGNVLPDAVVRPWRTHVDPTPVVPLEPTLYHVELWDVASRFPAGHRIKVVISSQEAYWFTQEVPPAVNAVVHDAAHPSRLILPVREGI